MAKFVSPQAWFDQFSGWDEEWVAKFLAENPSSPHPPSWRKDGQWCERHWAPCPVLGANGIGASAELMSIFVREILPANAKSAAMKSRELKKAGRICCKLGDERMYEIWGHWPPAAKKESVDSV
jgi:hypothetical protein